MDYEFVSRLQKSLDDYYQLKFSAFFNAKEFGDLREIQGAIKAIKKFSDLISQASNPEKTETFKKDIKDE